jgi:hypothetical protein
MHDFFCEEDEVSVEEAVLPEDPEEEEEPAEEPSVEVLI